MLTLLAGTEHNRAGRVRLTYWSDVSAALLLSASQSAAAPASPILLLDSLQRGEREEGQGCTGPPAQNRTEQNRTELNRTELTRATSASRCS
jgi:hypothetical protein